MVLNDLKRNEPMSKHTTFRVGGVADYFAQPQSVEELKTVIALCQVEQIPYFLIGNGSNLLVSDAGYRGVMVQLGKTWSEVTVENTTITVGAGALLSAVAKQALEQSLTGLEFAAGIPGTVGGAVVMNAGAYGSELKDILKTATVLTSQGEVKTLSLEALELGYRSSCIVKEQYIVLEVVLELKQGNSEEIFSRMQELAVQRKTKQPLEYPSAGSTFKRPEGYFAGKLIQDAGLRGFSVGGAQVSEKHCGFVINKDHASASDIYQLCQEVKRQVREQFDVTLELEVKLIGDWEVS